MSSPPSVSFDHIADQLRRTALPDCDTVVGIGSGGVVPAALVAYALAVPLHYIWLNFRGSDNRPRFDQPRVMRSVELPSGASHVLLVDDVSVSGSTLQAARRELGPIQVTTLVLKGKADIVLFPKLRTCVDWPWKQLQS